MINIFYKSLAIFYIMHNMTHSSSMFWRVFFYEVLQYHFRKIFKKCKYHCSISLEILSGAFIEMLMNFKMIFFWFQTDFTMIRGMIKKISLEGHAVLLSSMEERKTGWLIFLMKENILSEDTFLILKHTHIKSAKSNVAIFLTNNTICDVLEKVNSVLSSLNLINSQKHHIVSAILLISTYFLNTWNVTSINFSTWRIQRPIKVANWNINPSLINFLTSQGEGQECF